MGNTSDNGQARHDEDEPRRRGTGKRRTNRKDKKESETSQSYAYEVEKHLELTQEAKYTLKHIGQIVEGGINLVSDTHGQKIYLIKEVHSTYQGQFKNKLPDGLGEAYFDDGSYYSGEFVKGNADGKGVFIFRNGILYHGQFRNSEFQGEGTLIDHTMNTNSGSHSKLEHVYTGSFLAGKPDGRGCQYYPDGSKYEGYFKEGEKSGNGVYTWAGGELQYKGQFLNNLMHGEGVLMKGKQQKIIFAGNFQNGMKTGLGVFHTEQGDYMGTFNNDYLEGQGYFKWNDGKVYEGQFRKTKFDGKGVIYYPTGQVAQGKWEENHNKQLFQLENNKDLAENKIRQISNQMARYNSSRRSQIKMKENDPLYESSQRQSRQSENYYNDKNRGSYEREQEGYDNRYDESGHERQSSQRKFNNARSSHNSQKNSNNYQRDREFAYN